MAGGAESSVLTTTELAFSMLANQMSIECVLISLFPPE